MRNFPYQLRKQAPFAEKRKRSISKSFRGWGSGGRGVFQNASSPGNLMRLIAHRYYLKISAYAGQSLVLSHVCEDLH